jgi:hypothetical protein
VEQEFRDFLTCGVLAHGFARLRCTDCALERLVPFSCKGRGFSQLRRASHDRVRRAACRRRAPAGAHTLVRAVLGVFVRVPR